MSRTDLNDVFGRTSFLYGGNARFIEQLYARYLTDPRSVDPQWQSFFAGYNRAGFEEAHWDWMSTFAAVRARSAGTPGADRGAG